MAYSETVNSAQATASTDEALYGVPELRLAGDAAISTSTSIEKPVTVSRRWIWRNVFTFCLIHALAMLAVLPYFFSWTGVAACVLGVYLFGTLGINLCYHRLLTHKGMTVPLWLDRTLAMFGMCSLQESPLRWVAVHRMHHQYSDHRDDPHSPLVTVFWSHLGWLIEENAYLNTFGMYDRYAKDLLRDRFYREMEKGAKWLIVFAAHVLIIAGLTFGISMACGMATSAALQLTASVLVWGVAVRIVYVWHATWAVNSLTHVWGYRNYETTDNSRNNWLIALLVNGEGWHNNHHAYPRCASHGHRWWEFDVTYITIVVLEKIGLAKRVQHVPRPHANPS